MSTLQPAFDGDGRLDLDVVRSGNYDITEDTKVRAALIDEVEAARADRDLMRAVLNSIDLPSPETHGDTDAYHRLLEMRAMAVATALRDTLSGRFSRHDVPVMVKFLRKQIGAYPVTYKTTGGAR